MTTKVWELNKKRMTLTHLKNKYPIRLDTFTSSAEILDWIAQLSCKRWTTHEEIGELVEIINDAFDLQANYCSGGRDMKADPKKILEQ